jgi:TonB family protein
VLDNIPKQLRGQRLYVKFWIGADGKVLRVEVSPEIADKGFNKKFLEAMRDYRFNPARNVDGMPVPDTLTQSVDY